MLELVERHSTGKARLKRLLDEISDDGWCEMTLYFTPSSLTKRASAIPRIRPTLPGDDELTIVLQEIGESDTGLVLLQGQSRAVAICPPFPLPDDIRRSGLVVSPLTKMLDTEYVLGIVLLRLGRYAIGVLRGNRLIASKTDSRYMKNRHRAGGQSQRRFERSRERLIRELYDKTCEMARTVFAPYEKDMDYILLGGENSTLAGFTDRCRLMHDLSDKTLTRRLDIDQPNKKTLDKIAFEAWKSRVYTFQSIPKCES